MKHYFKNIETGGTHCITEHRDGTASFRQGKIVNGRNGFKIKYETKKYKSFAVAKAALGRYTGGWAREIK